MIAEQAHKDFPKLTEVETTIANIIAENPAGIHVNTIYKLYPARNYAVRCALQRLQAFNIAFSKDFKWYPNQELIGC